jgi:hypothetical protein
MKKSAIKIFIGVLIFFAFLSAFFIYLNKINRAVESNSRLLLLPEKIPLRKEGDQFYVYILLNSQVNKIIAVDTKIKFDKEILEAVDVVSFRLLATYPESARVIDNNNGFVYLSAVNYDSTKKAFTEPYQNIGLFGRMSFRVKKSLSTKIEFVFAPKKTDETNMIDGSGTDILNDQSQMTGAEIN